LLLIDLYSRMENKSDWACFFVLFNEVISDGNLLIVKS